MVVYFTSFPRKFCGIMILIETIDNIIIFLNQIFNRKGLNNKIICIAYAIDNISIYCLKSSYYLQVNT